MAVDLDVPALWTPVVLDLHVRYQPQPATWTFRERLRDMEDVDGQWQAPETVPEYETWHVHNLMRAALSDLAVLQHHRWSSCAHYPF